MLGYVLQLSDFVFKAPNIKMEISYTLYFFITIVVKSNLIRPYDVSFYIFR